MCLIRESRIFKIMNRSHRLLVTVIVFLIVSTVSLFAQNTGSIQYFYDDVGRLIRVVDQNGNVASYSYDAVGNILSITRSTVPVNNGLAILNFTPQSGPVGQAGGPHNAVFVVWGICKGFVSSLIIAPASRRKAPAS